VEVTGWQAALADGEERHAWRIQALEKQLEEAELQAEERGREALESIQALERQRDEATAAASTTSQADADAASERFRMAKQVADARGRVEGLEQELEDVRYQLAQKTKASEDASGERDHLRQSLSDERLKIAQAMLVACVNA